MIRCSDLKAPFTRLSALYLYRFELVGTIRLTNFLKVGMSELLLEIISELSSFCFDERRPFGTFGN